MSFLHIHLLYASEKWNITDCWLSNSSFKFWRARQPNIEMTDILVSGMSFYILFIYFMSQSFFSVIAFNLQRCIVTKCGLIFLVFVFAACSQTQKLIVGNIVVFNPTYKRARVKQASSVFPRSPLTLCHSVSPPQPLSLSLFLTHFSRLLCHVIVDWLDSLGMCDAGRAER